MHDHTSNSNLRRMYMRIRTSVCFLHPCDKVHDHFEIFDVFNEEHCVFYSVKIPKCKLAYAEGQTPQRVFTLFGQTKTRSYISL